MSAAERHALHHKEICKIGGAHKRIGGSAIRAIGFDRHGSNGQAKDAQRKAHVLECFEERLFVFLQIFVVAGGKALHHTKESGKQARCHCGFGADEFEPVRIFLLRHQAAAGGDLFRKLQKAEFFS